MRSLSAPRSTARRLHLATLLAAATALVSRVASAEPADPGATPVAIAADADAGVDASPTAPPPTAPSPTTTVDPSLGPDPFVDAGAPPATVLPTPPAVDLSPWSRPSGCTRPGDDDAEDEGLSFGGHHAKVRVTMLLQPQLAWEIFDASSTPNAGPDGTLPQGVLPNTTLGRGDGSTTNRATFRLRRARLGLTLRTSSPFGAVFEIDPNLADRENPASGTIARRIELMASTRERVPRYEVGAGLFPVPFSRDLAEPHAARIFVERAWGTRAMFPEDADMGVRFRRRVPSVGLTVDLAVVNGVAVGEPTFGRTPDLNKTKDVTARVALDLKRFEVGIGGYGGQGQVVNAQTFRVQQRPRAALVIDALFRGRVSRNFPETRISGEVVVGRNMDRGVAYPFLLALPADGPGLPNFDPRSAWLRLEQDLRALTLGIRYDTYTPDASEPDDSRHTFAVALARNMGRVARVVLEFDHVLDRTHAPSSPAPASTRQSEVLSLMGQFSY